MLRAKSNPNGREISWYKQGDRYALRYEEREKLIQDNIDEYDLFNYVGDKIRENIRLNLPASLHNRLSDMTATVHRCIDKMFQKQGVSIGLYLIDDEDSLGSIELAGDIDRYVGELALTAADHSRVRDSVSNTLRSIIYAPDPRTKEYLLRLSTTYFLLFALKNEPRVVEYFNSLAENLILYVGSDLIIKALSEYHLPVTSRMISNTLDVLRRSGAKLIMAHPAFEEVFSHVHASILEFESYYMVCESEIDEQFVQCIDRILIRAYFYARLGVNVEGKPPSGWRSYIGQFCTYENIRHRKGQDSLKMYLCDRFGLEFESHDSMTKRIDRDDLKKLVFSILEARINRFGKGTRKSRLAYNDALHILRVYTKRQEIDDNTAPNPFGFRTWWLTHEQVVRRVSAQVLGPEKPKAIMRPEFLLNYIELMPTKREVVNSFGEIFPTVLGVSLSKRAPELMLHTVLRAAREAFSVDSSRAKVMLNEFSDRLKTDQLHIYEGSLNGVTT